MALLERPRIHQPATPNLLRLRTLQRDCRGRQRTAGTEEGEGEITAPKWTRPAPGPTAAVFLAARMALSDAQAAGDPAYAARILMAAAAQCARYDRAWCLERPPLGVRRQGREAA